jgi:MoaA/NifB/PqqE/SkfB family radical SAM enzyme
VIIIKNVILYDPYGHVVGFVEFKNANGVTHMKVKHNLSAIRLTMAVNDDKYNMTVKDFTAESKVPIDLDSEIRVEITEKNGNTVATLASGVINEEQAKPISRSLNTLPPIAAILNHTEEGIIRPAPIFPVEETSQTSAIREVDEVLRAVCQIDEKGKGMCESCPYREFFFGEQVSGDNLGGIITSLPNRTI